MKDLALRIFQKRKKYIENRLLTLDQNQVRHHPQTQIK